MKKDFARVRLCVIVSREISPLPFDKFVREVILGGADCIQLREKNMPDGELLRLAKLCREASGDAIFIVNDRPDIALLSGADGVHLGQDDMPVPEARKIVGEDMIIGLSTHSAAEIEAARGVRADYLGVGCIFPTATKKIAVAGIEYVREASSLATLPFLAIGGINKDNISSVIAAGARGVAVVSAVAASNDPRSATKLLRKKVLDALGQSE